MIHSSQQHHYISLQQTKFLTFEGFLHLEGFKLDSKFSEKELLIGINILVSEHENVYTCVNVSNRTFYILPPRGTFP